MDGTQELIALGMCTLVGSFFQAMPVTGSFTRSAINHASGVRSTLGGVVTTILVLLSLAYLTQSFRYMPKATLAGVIITAMIFMVEFRAAAETWRVKSKFLIRTNSGKVIVMLECFRICFRNRRNSIFRNTVGLCDIGIRAWYCNWHRCEYGFHFIHDQSTEDSYQSL